MNHEHDPLESELAALHPRAPSADLSHRIADRLEEKAILSRRRRRWIASTIGLAASVALIFLVWRVTREKAEPTPISLGEPVAVQPTVRRPSPIGHAFNRTLIESPEALEEWMSRPSVAVNHHEPSTPPMRAFTRVEPEFLTLQGDL